MIEIDEMHEEAEMRLQSAWTHKVAAQVWAERISDLYRYGRAKVQDTQDAWWMVKRLQSSVSFAQVKLKEKDYEYIDWLEQYAADVHDKLKITHESLCTANRE